MTRVYYQEAVGALMVFDVTRASTFDTVLKWKEDLDSKVSLPPRQVGAPSRWLVYKRAAVCPQVTLNHGRPVPTVLLANKSDQVASRLPKLDAFCRENGFVGWFETSAKVRKEDLNNNR